MTIKVVRGNIGSAQQSQLDSQRQTELQAARTSGAKASQNPANVQSQLSSLNNTFGSIARSSDAVITTLRSVAKSMAPKEERIKEYGEAKQVAEKVADDVRSNKGEGLAAHSDLAGSSAKDHFD